MVNGNNGHGDLPSIYAAERESQYLQVNLSPFLSLQKQQLRKQYFESKIISVVGWFHDIINLWFTIASSVYVTSFTKFVAR